jgi:tetratricopeptide (TPR) repeat protein
MISRPGVSLLLVAFSVLTLSGCPTREDRAPTVPASVKAYLKESASAGQEGDRFQKAGDWGNALAKYEAVVRAGDGALNEYQSLGIEFKNRHWLAYYLPALGHYDAARMQIELQNPVTDINGHLQRAQQAITGAISLDQISAGPTGKQYTANAWKLFYFRANIYAMLGDMTSARSDYVEVSENLNKGFRPAVEQVAMIDYIEGRNSSDRSPGGLKFPEKPRLLSTKMKVDLLFIFSKYVFSKYSDEIGFAKNVADALMQ